MGSRPRFNRPSFEILLDQHSSSPSTIRSLPDLIEYNARENPSHVFCVQFKQSKAGAAAGLGFVNVTFEELKEAIDRCCLWLLQHIPDAHQAESSSDGSVRKSAPVALFVESDLGLFIHVAALLTLNIPVILETQPSL